MKTLLLALVLLSALAGCGGAIDAPLPSPDAGTCDNCNDLNDCSDPSCQVCIPEDDRAFCLRLGKNCDMVHDLDNCVVKRSVVCGSCSGAATCGGAGVANVCAVPPTESSCTDHVDNDGDGLTDCADPECIDDPACRPPQGKACKAQSDCGDIVNETVTDCCIDGHCRPPGAVIQGSPVDAQIDFRLVFEADLTGGQKPGTTVVRFIYPTRTDGSRLTCADLLALGNCRDQSTRSVIDHDGVINQVFRTLYPMDFGTCSSGECSFSGLSATVPQGRNLILYGETWYGPRDLNEPTGTCAAVACTEGHTVAVPDALYQLTFK
jgi:hypothetical protein